MTRRPAPERRRARARGARAACVGALAILLAPGPAVAAETLTQALARAYRSNPALAAERARQRADDENVPRALSGFRPSVSVDLGFGPTFERDGQGRLRIASPGTYALNLSQTLYDGQRTAASVRSAESGVLAGRETLRSLEQTVLLTAVTAFMNVIRDRAVVELQRGNVGFLEEALRIARKRFETGDRSQTDAVQAEARLARGKADFALAGAALVASRAAYRAAVGTEPGALVQPDPEGFVEPGESSLQLRAGFDEHPDVRAAMHEVDASTNDVIVARSDLLPSVTAQAGIAGAIGRGLDNDTPRLAPSAGIAATVPIYDGGLASAQVRQAKETVGQRRFELEAARDQITADFRTNSGSLRAARDSARAARVAVEANEIALAGVQREAQGGQRTTLDILNAQQELVNARTNLIAAQRDRVVAYFATLSSSGALSHAHLRLPGPAYRPETHAAQTRDLWFGLSTPDGR